MPGLPYPPPAKGEPVLDDLLPDIWWRGHIYDPATGKFSPDAFNDSGRGDARFSPLHDAGKKVVPTMYGGDTLEGALLESVLHNIPRPSTGFIFPLSKILREPHYASQIEITRALRFVDLTTTGLQPIGLVPAELIDTDQDDYPRTREWSTYLYNTCPMAQGLLWMSRRDNTARAIMLFGNRLGPGDIKVGPARLIHVSLEPIRSALVRLLGKLRCGTS